VPRGVEPVMAQQEAFVDAAAVHAVANRFDDAAHLIDGAVRAHFGRLAFDGTTSGRAYIGQGDALRFAVHRLAGDLAQWVRASMEVAAALRASANRFADADQFAAARVG
jgi:Excreted virulence factor EspC, type VII ESX diderm